MTENKGKEAPQGRPAEDDDVEGHMMINPTLASDVARVRSKDVERAAQQRNRAKEAKR
ncbi:MAG: hypothetical protein AB1Z63_09590 [Candidatus Limnocylindrales bacterium]